MKGCPIPHWNVDSLSFFAENSFADDVAIAYERCLILDVGTDNLVRDYWVV